LKGKSMKNVWFIFIVIGFVTTVLLGNNTLSKEEIIQRIDTYQTLPDHKAIVAAIDSREHRAIGFSMKKKDQKIAKNLAYEECETERVRKKVSAPCRILALDDAVGCKEIKKLLYKKFDETRNRSEKIKRIYNCLEKKHYSLVEKCVEENRVSHKVLSLWKHKKKRESTLENFSQLIKEMEQANKILQENIDNIECEDYSAVQ